MKKIKLLMEIFNFVKIKKRIYIIGLLLMFISSVSKIMLPFFILKILDNAISYNNMKLLIRYTIGMIICTLLGSLCDYVYQIMLNHYNRELVVSLRNDCFDHLERMSGDFLTSYSSGDVFTCLYRDVEEIPNILTTSLLNFISNIILIIGYAYYLVTLQFDLLLILIAFQIMIFAIQKKYNSIIEKSSEHTRHAISSLNSSAQEMISNLFAFNEGGLKSYFRKKHNNLENNFAKSFIENMTNMIKNNLILSGVNLISMASILCYGGMKVIAGSLSYGGLVTFNIYSQRFMGPIMNLVRFNNDLVACMVSWERLQKLLNIESTVVSGNEKIDLTGDIIFENTRFKYEESKDWILNDMSLTIFKGKIHAIVGKSGCGKTTLIHLLYRLWDVEQGKISINGKDIKRIEIEYLRKQISIVSQNIFLLDDSIYNNIVLGQAITQEELEVVLKEAELDVFIENLPNKLNTMVGENGIKLSGGEKQRISIARALIRKSPLLVFDEATSMLDNDTEDKIISILLKSFRDRTIILIAHRLSTVKNADIIYVIDNGHVGESGTHEELLHIGGLYAELYNI